MAESKKSNFWGLNKIAFYTMGAVAILYLVSLILHVCGINFLIVSILQDIATVIMISIVAVLGWRFVRSKAIVWKVLYFVFLLIVIIGIIIPLVV